MHRSLAQIIPILTLIACQSTNRLQMQDGLYVNAERPGEGIIVGWHNRIAMSLNYVLISKSMGREAFDVSQAYEYEINAWDQSISIFPTGSGDPVLSSEWFWDSKTESIVQVDRSDKYKCVWKRVKKNSPRFR